MAMQLELIPENAPFSSEQRAWLNGFFAGLLSLEQLGTQGAAQPLPAEEEDYPWHDPSIELDERMKLAEGRPFELKLMAAMGQLDCGQCGYLCKSYAEVIARGEEQDLTLCVPGGRATARRLKELVAVPSAIPARAPSRPAPSPIVNVYTRKHPFRATLKEVTRLTGEASIKDTRHVVIDLSGSGITYEPGDSLGMFPQNCPHLVQAILHKLGASGEEQIETWMGAMASRQALIEVFDITRPSDQAVAHLGACASDPTEAEQVKGLAEQGIEEAQDLLDLLEDYPSARPRIEELVPLLGRLQPRLFSIASSLKAHKDEVHLTVGVVRYERKKRMRKGVASTFFADRLYPGDGIKVYVQPTYSFRLPRNGDTPMIMVGPGTGIAPFRAFLEERRARGARGQSWLFFGNPNAATDFCYQEELEGYLREGGLTRLDTAFSRDQRDKLYVQHRMLQHSKDLWSWLQEGAYFYVCGDASRMALDVDEALHRIAAQIGKLSEEEAARYVKKLAAEGRYLKDVY
jgi:sulfite reductase (NADPH) flavoprotein alpha-component